AGGWRCTSCGDERGYGVRGWRGFANRGLLYMGSWRSFGAGEFHKQIVERRRTDFVTQVWILGDKRGQTGSIERDVPCIEDLGGPCAADFEPRDGLGGVGGLGGEEDDVFANDIAKD